MNKTTLTTTEALEESLASQPEENDHFSKDSISVVTAIMIVLVMEKEFYDIERLFKLAHIFEEPPIFNRVMDAKRILSIMLSLPSEATGYFYDFLLDIIDDFCRGALSLEDAATEIYNATL